MTNPLSGLGWSDQDYASAIGTLTGEAAVGANLQDYQAIADVIANRQQTGRFGNTITGITRNPSEFSTWSTSKQTQAAYRNAMAGFAAALNPERAATLTPALRDRVELAQQALDDVFNNATARGLTQGATFYDNPEVTARLGTGGFHNGLARRNGSMVIGDHRFTGPGFRPDQPFDPITYNGQLAAPPPADDAYLSWSDLSLPDNYPVNDYEAMVDLAAPELPAADLPATPDLKSYYDGVVNPVPTGKVDFAGYLDTPAPTMSQQTFDSVFDAGFPTATPMSQSTFNDVFDQGFPEQATTTGYHAGTGMGAWGSVPDFAAPSLEDRNATQLSQDRINTFESHQLPGISYPNLDKLNTSLMNELAPTPSAPTTTSSWSLKGATLPSADFDFASIADLPSVNATPAALPSSRSGGSFADLGGWSLNSLDFGLQSALTSGAAYGPTQTASFGPLGWGDKGLTIGGFASPMDALSGLFGGQPTAPAPTQTQNPGFGFSNPLAGLSGLLGGMFDGGLFGGSEGYYGGGTNGPGSTRGDGSYAESAGYSDNNPQGIL